MKNLFTLVLLLTGILALLIGCSADADNNQATDTQIYTVQKGSIANQITATGNLQMPNQAKLTFGASGTVDEILVKIGDEVKSGHVLAKLDAVTVSSLQQSLLQAQIDVKTAQMNLDNAKTPTLSSSGATVSAPDPLAIEAKELALERAKLNLDSAQRQLDGSIITAPFDGLVAAVNALVGDKVTTGTVVVRLIDPDIMTVDTLVNETDIFNVKLGASASIQVVALSNVVLPATVTAISPAATISGGVVNYTVQLKVTSPTSARPAFSITDQAHTTSDNKPPNFPGSSDNQTGFDSFPAGQRPGVLPAEGMTVPTLKEGLSVNITLVISEKEGVLIIPSRALTREGNNAFVQIYIDDESTEKRSVKTGISDWQNTEITEGLAEGEKIAIARTTTKSTSTSSPTQGMGPPTGGGPTMIIR